MYDKRKKGPVEARRKPGKAGAAASAGWVLVFLAISILVAWAEFSDDSGNQAVIPVESACLHPHVCIG